MNVGSNAALRFDVEKSPILPAKNRHTVPGIFWSNSLKTNDGDLNKVTHFSGLAKSPENGRRK
jgi:hypothetical protein